MNSSYFAVPGRGGTSAGIPPAHCGTYSPMPEASFSLIDAQPARLHATVVAAARAATRRKRTVICKRMSLCRDGRDIRPGLVLREARSRIFDLEPRRLAY